MVWFQSPFLTERKESLPGEASDLAIRLVQAGFVSRIPADDPLVRSEPVWGFFLLQRCLGKSRAVRPSVSKAKETTGMYNRPLNTFQSKLSNKLVKEGRLEYQASKMHCLTDERNSRPVESVEGQSHFVGAPSSQYLP